jgi:hypothetical protein
MEVVIILVCLAIGIWCFIRLFTRKNKVPNPETLRLTAPVKTMATANFSFESKAIVVTKPTTRQKPKSATTFGNFQIAGYHHLPEDVKKMVWKELKEKDKLTLVPITDNLYDDEAVSVRFNSIHIGWIPRDCRRKKEIFNTLSQGKEVKAVCISNRRKQDTWRASRPDTYGKWNDISRQAQFVDVKFIKDRE